MQGKAGGGACCMLSAHTKAGPDMSGLARRGFIKSALALGGVAAAGRQAWTQNAPVVEGAYPNRPVRFIVPLAAGGGLDFIARLVGEYISRELGQQVFIENRTGAGGTIGIDAAIKCAAGRLFVAAHQRQRGERAACDEAERRLPQGPDAGEPARAPAAGVGGASLVRREVDRRTGRGGEEGSPARAARPRASARTSTC